MSDVIPELKSYVESKIFPMYSQNDDAHNLTHISMVIDYSIEIAKYLNSSKSHIDIDEELDLNKAYTIAAYHDIGLRFGRKNHEITSAAYLLVDENLRNWFSEDEIMLMKEAIEDHRSSIAYTPRSIYGKIINDADSMQPCEIIVDRCMIYGKKNFPELDFEKQVDRILEHINDKYAEGGYLRLWVVTPEIFTGLKDLRNLAKDKDAFSLLCKKYF